ncbi:MAG: biotin-dependent carboxyltransferase family protein [Marinirhabdus sp.]|nr:biotin-dependent carboxyltransferase family protein [Marinirhabdus sp.]
MIEVIHAGLYTSIQDVGRYGYRNLGVPLSGVMDRQSAEYANEILGNDKNKALIEFTLQGPTLKFTLSTEICCTGATFQLLLNKSAVPMNKAITVKPGDVLSIATTKEGMRGYLAVRGGIQTKQIMGSRSFYQGITTDHILKKGMKIPLHSHVENRAAATYATPPKPFTTNAVEVYVGPEFHRLTTNVQQALLAKSFKISPQSNRMAYVLESTASLAAAEIVTGPVQTGTVQLTPSGTLVVLMRDAQTTGGYSRVLQLTERAISQLSQKRGGEMVRFELLEL